MKHNNASIEQYKVRPAFCGLPEYKLNTIKYTINMETDTNLCILNTFRKVIMAFLPVQKFKIQQFQTNDKFLIQEFIEKRLQQIPLNLKNNINTQFSINVKNNMQEPMIVYTDHIHVVQEINSQSGKGTNNITQQNKEVDKIALSITQDLQLADTYNILKLQEGCYLKVEMGLISQQPESDDKFRGCFISIFEDESQITDNYIYLSNRPKSKVCIQTYGSMDISEFQKFFVTEYIRKLFASDILIRIDKDQSTIVFNNTPLFIVDCLLCLHKDYFFSTFKSVVPTTTNDYQSSLILIPYMQNDVKQSPQDNKTNLNGGSTNPKKSPVQNDIKNISKLELEEQLQKSIKLLLTEMQNFEQELVDIIKFLIK